MSRAFQIVVTFNPESPGGASLAVAAPADMPMPIVVNTLQAAVTQCLIQQITAEIMAKVGGVPRVVQLDDVPPEVRRRLLEGGP